MHYHLHASLHQGVHVNGQTKLISIFQPKMGIFACGPNCSHLEIIIQSLTTREIRD